MHIIILKTIHITNKKDLEKFEQFRRKFDPSYAARTGSGGQSTSGVKINWPTGANNSVF